MFSKKDENNEVIKINKTLNLINIIEAIDNPNPTLDFESALPLSIL